MAVIATGAITITDLNDGHSGGRNYIRNSGDMIYADHHGIVEPESHTSASFTNVNVEVPDGSISSALQLSGFNGATYRLDVLPHIDGSYVYTVWARALTDMTLSIDMLGKTESFELETTGGWTKLEIANDGPTSSVIDISPVYDTAGVNGDLLLYRSMLELGDVASDWSPAPEDAEEDTMELTERLASAEEKIEDDRIVNTVLESTRYTNGVAELERRVGTTITQLNESITAEFEDVREEVTDTYGEAKRYVDSAKSWQRFDAEGIHMGNTESDLTMDLSNTELAFRDRGTRVAYISNQALQITDAVVNSRFRIGRFAFVPTDTGMALIYVGDEN